MPLYSDFFYGQGALTLGGYFYGATPDLQPPGGPRDLNSYQNLDGNIILYWGLNPCSIFMDDIVWTVQTDLIDTFDSAQLRTYTSTGNTSSFISGCVRKGMVVNAYELSQGERKRMHWRIKGAHDGSETIYVASSYNMRAAVDQVTRQAMLDALPDVIYKKDFAAGEQQILSVVFSAALITGNTYNLTVNGTPLTPTAFSVSNDATLATIATKIDAVAGISKVVVISGGAGTGDDREIRITATEKDSPISLAGSLVTGGASQATTKTVLKNSTNVNRLYDALGKQRDSLAAEVFLTDNDLFAHLVRDQSLKENFAFLFDIEQPSDMKAIDFREIVRTLMREAGNTPSFGAVKRVIASIYCAEPTFSLIRDTLGMYVDDSTSSPTVVPFHVDDSSSSPAVSAETVWDDSNLAFGVIINISNPIGCSIPAAFTKSIVAKLVPVHAPIYFTGI